MKSVLVALVTFAAAAFAVDETCGAQYIVDACMDLEKAKLDACAHEDWDCKCNAHINILTCFNNCPNDKEALTWDGQRQIHCGYASQYPSTTAKVPGATKTGAASVQTTGAEQKEDATNTDKSGATGTGTGTAAVATKTDSAAADLAYNAGSMLAAVAAVAAVVL